MNQWKYLSAYLVPLSCAVAIYFQGPLSYSALIFAFVFIPLFEPLLNSSKENLSEESKNKVLSNRFFDWLLYLNIPIVYGLLFWGLYTINSTSLELYELIGLILSIGVVLGSNGINVAHELGHRTNRKEQMLSKILLLPSQYMHFFIEHNRGHHKNVSTPLDPASARKNEIIYLFWIRSVFCSYANAWKLESKRLKKIDKSFFSLGNEMLAFTFVQTIFLGSIFVLSDIKTFMAYLGMAIIGFLLLETINYIEHYGLKRKLKSNGKYERAMPKHSWNSNHYLGRIMLYELTRHSDHHYIASKKYPTLDHHDEAPILPFGYPTCMLISLVPPLWFGLMNKRIP